MTLPPFIDLNSLLSRGLQDMSLNAHYNHQKYNKCHRICKNQHKRHKKYTIISMNV